MTTTSKKNLRTEVLLRTAHNQFRINNIKETIRCFLKQKYKEEFDDLVEVIPKLNRFLNYCQNNSEDYDKLSCPENILNMDVFNHIRKYTADIPEIRLMSIEENYMYRELVVNKDDTEEDEVLDLNEIDVLEEEEKERLLYKPYHDQDIASN